MKITTKTTLITNFENNKIFLEFTYSVKMVKMFQLFKKL